MRNTLVNSIYDELEMTYKKFIKISWGPVSQVHKNVDSGDYR